MASIEDIIRSKLNIREMYIGIFTPSMTADANIFDELEYSLWLG